MPESDEDLSDVERKFASMERAIALAAREQGADPEENIWLRCAVDRAERAHMEEHRIERALERGAGETDDPRLERLELEGYGPEDVAVFVRAITEDPAGSRESIDELFREYGGNVGEEGCVAWQFDSRGIVYVEEASVADEDDFTLVVIEAGGDELGDPLYGADDDQPALYRVYCGSDELLSLARNLDDQGYDVYDLEWTKDATQHVELSSDEARRFLEFNEALSKRVDVQDVFSNWTSA